MFKNISHLLMLNIIRNNVTRINITQCYINVNQNNLVNNLQRILNVQLIDLCLHKVIYTFLMIVHRFLLQQAAVWLKVAESFDCLNENEKSIEAYYMVLSLAPQHVSVRMTLATLLRGVGRADEAMTVISGMKVTS